MFCTVQALSLTEIQFQGNFSGSKSGVLTLLKAAEIMEEQIDSEMKKMDELDDDDIEKIRQRRLKAMQKAHQAKQVISFFHNRFDVSFRNSFKRATEVTRSSLLKRTFLMRSKTQNVQLFTFTDRPQIDARFSTSI